MSKHPVKKYPTIGCCGLDCGLCPRYYTVGSSRCPGCCGPGFFDVYPSCSYITCCVKKRGREVCAECDEFPCSKFESWLANGGKYDSFLTHKKANYNTSFIRKHGIEKFIEQQRKRIKILEAFLRDFNDGRSKSYFCIAVTLLPIEDLELSIAKARSKIKEKGLESDDIKTKNKIVKEFLNNFAVDRRIELKLRRKPKIN